MIARLLTAHNAEINTATVTIKTLQVEGKQVTLALFRQIQERDIVDQKTMTLCGVAWGWVNYYCEPPNINLVWQQGNELRRCVVNPKAYWRRPDVFHCNVRWDYDTKGNRLKFVCSSEYAPCRKLERSPLFEVGGVVTGESAKVAEDAQISKCKREQRLVWLASMAHAERYEKLVAPLFDTPQLFVAV